MDLKTTMQKSVLFDINCVLCPRLAQFLKKVRKDYPGYHALPVPAFGAEKPDVLIVGLAPGLHGANATGRPFTGDYAGIMLYQTLYDFGFSSGPVSKSRDDGLKLYHCRITNAVKCVPPQNKPTGEEITTCNRYLHAELAVLKNTPGVIALGRIAHNAVLKAMDLKQKDYPFEHALLHRPPNKPWIIDSYHCSRYNTQTGRLNQEMFNKVFQVARRQLQKHRR
jgi:uracil-DNA glycosylase family 4